jgi:hypothetical protein
MSAIAPWASRNAASIKRRETFLRQVTFTQEETEGDR